MIKRILAMKNREVEWRSCLCSRGATRRVCARSMSGTLKLWKKPIASGFADFSDKSFVFIPTCHNNARSVRDCELEADKPRQGRKAATVVRPPLSQLSGGLFALILPRRSE